MPPETRTKVNLRARLTLTYLGLAILPLLLVATLTGNQNVAELKAQSESLQRAIATRVAQEISGFIDGRFQEIRTFVLGAGLARLDGSAQRAQLGKLLAHGRLYQDITLIDGGGRVRVHLSRTEVTLGDQEAQSTTPTDRQRPYFGQVRFDPDLREPLATISLPMFDLRSGEPVLVLIATLRLVSIWGLLGQMELPPGVEVFVLDADRRVVAHRNPATVLAGTRLPAPRPDGTIRVDGREVLAVPAASEQANPPLRVLATRPTSIAYASATRALTITASVTAIGVLVAGLLVVLSVRQIVRPIEALAHAARRVSAGDLDFEPEVGGQAEVGMLALAFKQMLRDLHDSMRDARETHQRLLRQEKLAAIGQMSGELGHELRNPLAAIANSVALLNALVPAEDMRLRRSIDRIDAQVQRITRLTNELLSFARTRTPQRTEVAVETLIRGALERRPPPSNVTVKRCMPDTVASPVVDREQIEQVLENIVSNAYEAMPDGGGLTIRVTTGQQLVRCAFVDTGGGIPHEALDRVFEPLYTTKREGVGLGLAICKNLSEANGGSLSIESVVGEGTTFTLELPTATNPGSTPSPPVSPAAG